MRLRLVMLAIVSVWLVYEVIMAFMLRARLGVGDWVALGYKLVFLSLALYLLYTGRFRLVCAIAPAYSGAVRAAGGWLSYTWFTVMAPLLGALVCLMEGHGGSQRGVATNLGVALFMLATLAGRVYQAPASVEADMVAGLLLGLAASLAVDRGSIKLVWPVVMVVFSWLLLFRVGG